MISPLFFEDKIFLYFYYAHNMTLRVPKSYNILSTSEIKYKKKIILDIIPTKLMLQRKMVLWSSLCYWANKNCLFFIQLQSRLCDQKSVIIHLSVFFFYLNCAWYNYFVEYNNNRATEHLNFYFFHFELKLLLSIIIFFFNFFFVWIKQIRHMVPLTLDMLL